MDKTILALGRPPPANLLQSIDIDIESAAFLGSVLNASSDCIKVLSLDGKLLFMNNGGLQTMEVDDFDTMRGSDWSSFWVGDYHSQALEALATAKSGGTGKFTGMADTAKGNPRWWNVTVTPILGAKDKSAGPSHILSISRDVTETRTMQLQRELLTSELDHRLKNLLAVVAAVATQTFSGADRDILGAFTSRLVALGNAQSLLVQSAWQYASMAAVVSNALKPHVPPDRAHWSGPDLLLSAKEALALALAVHELATNATKYGAWSNVQGRVDVTWTENEGEFAFQWIESGGPRVEAPTRTGFGSRILKRNLAGEFNGRVEADYRPSGLQFTLIASR